MTGKKKVIKEEFDGYDKRLELLTKIDKIILLKSVEDTARKERLVLEAELGI